MDNALQLLTKIDPAPDGTTQEVFQLVNANATEVAETLTNTLARQLSTAAANSGDSDENTSKLNTATVELAAKEPTIIADQRTNTLIVRGTPAQVAQVAALIPTLDSRVPQVNLQVRIQEITETDSDSLGVNWKAYAGGFSVAASSDGLRTAFNPLQSVVGFNIFPALNALESQNLSKRLYDGTVSLQSGQRPLGQSSNVSSSLGTPAAVVRSGGEVEYIVNTAGDVRVVPYGVILSFYNPVVAPDGTITVTVRGEISEIQNSAVFNEAIASGASPKYLNFTKSQAETKISFKPGETVLLSGLGIKNEVRNKSGVPYLSQLPGVGALFGSQSTDKTSTDMLFVVTADLIQ